MYKYYQYILAYGMVSVPKANREPKYNKIIVSSNKLMDDIKNRIKERIVIQNMRRLRITAVVTGKKIV